MKFDNVLARFRAEALRKGHDIAVSAHTRRYYRLDTYHKQRLAQLAVLHRTIGVIERHVRKHGATAYDDALLSLAISKLQAVRSTSRNPSRRKP